MSGARGQGRRFDVDEALEAATLQFWEHGYEATSVAALTAAMGINPPSLYKAFGSKEELFFRVVERYQETHGAFTADAFEQEDSALPLIRRLLLAAAETYPRGPAPGGCLVLTATVTVGEANRHVGERLAAIRNDPVTGIRKRIQAEIDAGTARPAADATAIARFVGACIQGMSQQARDGADAGRLREVARIAIRAVEAELS
ncbi:TetR/AcrR family transcriptional regulator [Myceligenerans crystallogenes]|uniref:TetR/AcrR family transcriptional regulator n=1 Tax=Myceligenerans crystallogenes TaxID=316335 RepID=A0ABN2NF64_9MICO